MDGKEIAARSAVAAIRDGMVVGLGSGSTSLYAVRLLAARVRDERLRIRGVPTSTTTEGVAQSLGIELVTLEEAPQLDVAIDGADQVDKELACIKGYGGALLREKIVARCSKRFLVMVDPSKLADVLDKPVPVEVLPFGMGAARRGLEGLGGRPVLRVDAEKKPVRTDNDNLVLDVAFGRILDPAELARRIASVPGVLDHGLFVDLVDELHVGEAEGAQILTRMSRS